MRAGCFAEPRVIHLLNRRFIGFYYNTDNGPPQPNFTGKDLDAKAFIGNKTKNKWAFFAAFTAQGEHVGVTDIYSTKDNVFDFLVALLREYPEYNRFTQEEETLLARAKAQLNDAKVQLEAGRLFEDLGEYGQAVTYYERVVQLADRPAMCEAYRGMLRMTRHLRQWDRLETLCTTVEKRPDASQLALGGDLAAERGHHLRARKQYAKLRQTAEAAIRAFPESQRTSELRFHAGVACYFLKDKAHASLHWCWVVENLPDDHLARRCYIAAAHEGMPYKNPELDNYEAPLHGGRTEVIQAAYDRARETYQQLHKQ